MTKSFITRLSSETVDETVATNMYYGKNETNKTRLANFEKYLNYFVVNKPKLILVGEAPGYKGCCVSGIPFTSTAVIKKSPFFRNIAVSDVEYEQNEATATIIWEYLDKRGVYLLFWNAYPFHPHKENNPKSNLKPKKSQLELGRTYLNELRELFPEAKLVAVGRVAQKSLESEGIKADYVRHPANGGKAEFIKGLDELLK